MLDQPKYPVDDPIPASVQAFCNLAQPYAPDEANQALFIEAMAAITDWHIRHSPWYARFARQQSVNPDRIKTLADTIALPPVPAEFFKAHEIRSIHADQVAEHMTSSGTSGQKSQIFFDRFTIDHAREMVRRVMRVRGVEDSQPAHYLVNAYEPFSGFKVGTSRTNQFLMQFAPVAEDFWSLRHIGDGKHEFDAFGAIAKLKQWAAGNTPVRIIGFPAFTYFLLQRMRQMQEDHLTLPAGSMVLFGGGWKGYADQAISKPELAQQIEQQLGIPPESVVESYGAVEHAIPYVDSPKHRLHQPSYSRVVIRDVRTMQPVADGTPGFLSFISPYITSTPAHSVVMGDLAIRHPADPDLEPDHPTPWFEILGRAGTASNKSCAAAAAEMLKS